MQNMTSLALSSSSVTVTLGTNAVEELKEGQTTRESKEGKEMKESKATEKGMRADQGRQVFGTSQNTQSGGEKVPWTTKEEVEKKLAAVVGEVQRNEVKRLNLSIAHFGRFYEQTEPFYTFSGHQSSVRCLAVLPNESLPNGGLASGSEDNTIKLWDTSSGSCLSTLSGHTWGFYALAVLPNGNLASGSGDNTIKLWDTSSGSCLSTLYGHIWGFYALAVLPNGNLASGSGDNTIKLWNTSLGSCLSILSGHTSGVCALAVLPNGNLASGSADNTIKLWDTASGSCLSTLSGHTDYVRALAVLPNGNLASGSEDNTIKLWDTSSGSCLSTLYGHTKAVYALAVLPNGNLASGSEDRTIKLWDTASGSCLSSLSEHTSSVWALAALPNGNLASGSSDKTIKLWKPKVKNVSFSTKQVLPLLDALKTNTSVTLLDLSGNPDINDDIINPLITLFEKPGFFSFRKQNTSLKTINLRKTGVTKVGVEKLQKAIAAQSLSVTILSDEVEEEKLRVQQSAQVAQAAKESQAKAETEQKKKQEAEKAEKAKQKLAEEKRQKEKQEREATEKAQKEAEEKKRQELLEVQKARAAKEQQEKLEREKKEIEEKRQNMETQVVAEASSSQENFLQQYTTSLASLQPLSTLDLQALRQLDGKAVELQGLISKETAAQLAALEREEILKDDKLADYYFVFIRQFTDCWIACQAIHSGKIDNDEKTFLEYVGQGIDSVGQYIPGLHIISGMAATGASALCYRSKKHAVNQIACFFDTIVHADEIIETVARQLALFQVQEIQQIVTQKPGVFKRIVQAVKNIKCALTVDDVDTEIRRKAAADVKKILEAIVDGTLKSHPELKDVILLFRCVAGVKATYVSPIISKAQTKATNPSTNTTPTPTSSAQISIQATAMTSTTFTTSLSSTTGSSSSMHSVSSTAMTLQALSSGVSQTMASPAAAIDVHAFKEMQEEIRRLKEQAEKDKEEKRILKEQAEQAAADAKAAREKAEKAERKATATQQAVEQSGISVGENSAQLSASASANGNPIQQQADMVNLMRDIVRDELRPTHEALTHLQEQQEAFVMQNAASKKNQKKQGDGKVAALQASAKKESAEAKLEQANHQKNPHFEEDRKKQKQKEEEAQKQREAEHQANHNALLGSHTSSPAPT